MSHQNENEVSGALKSARPRLARRVAQYRRDGTVLQPGELMALYEHRHQIRPNKAEAGLMLASMLHEELTGIRCRKNELGWFWFRHTPRHQLGELLVELAHSRNRSVGWPAVSLLAHVATKAEFTALQKLAKNPDGEIAAEAVGGLAGFPASKASPALRRVAQDDKLAGYVRGRALNALARFKRREDGPFLRALAADSAPEVRWQVIEALSEYQCPEDVKVLRKLTRDRDENVRYKAVQTIGCYGQPEDRCWLRAVVEDAKHPHRSEAVVALAEFKDLADLSLFRKLTRDGDFIVRWKAALALGRFQHPADVALLQRMARRQSAGPLDALMAYPAKMVAGIFRALAAEKDSCLRGNLAMRLGDWCHPDATVILRRLAEDDEYDIRAAAAASLGAHRKAKDLPLLRRMSRWDTESVRREAVWAVAKFRKPEDIAFLKERTRDEAPAVRTVAALALTRILKRDALERWLEKNPHKLSFQALVEFDFALYAPRWLAKTNPRIGDGNLGMELGMNLHHRAEW